MAKQNSFDIVSKVDMAEVKNAINQADKELGQRYDLKNTRSSVELNEKERKITLASQDEYTCKVVDDIVKQKLHRRGVSLKALEHGKYEPASGDTVRQVVTLQDGISTEKAKEVVKEIKNSKLKVQAAIQEDFVRVTGKDRDVLQEVIALLKAKDFGIDMQFTNYR